MKKSLLILIALLFALSLFAQTAHARTYKIGTTPEWIPWSPLQVADIKGFWKEQSIEVQLNVYANDSEMFQACENKKIDMDMCMLGTAVDLHLKGKPIKIIMEADWSNGGDKIIVKKDISSSLKDLKKEKIAVYLNSLSLTFFLNKFLQKNDLKFSEMTLIEMSDTEAAANFIANRFKAVLNCDPSANDCVDKGNGVVLSTTADFPGCMPEGIIAFDEVLKSIPEEDMVKILKGWMKAVNWIKDPQNWTEYQKILDESVFQGKGYKEADYKEMLASVSIHDTKTLSERHKDGGGLVDYIKELGAFIKENKLSDKQLNPADLIDSTFIIKALK